MSSVDLNKIRLAAKRFRSAWERTDLSGFVKNLANFPKNCCHYAEALLGLYLLDEGLGIFDKGEGEHPLTGEYHTWLERDGLVIDITADQFPGVVHKVIVSSSSAWHASLKNRRLCLTDEVCYNRRREHYAQMYALIQQNIRRR
jgi:hypothetical protein